MNRITSKLNSAICTAYAGMDSTRVVAATIVAATATALMPLPVYADTLSPVLTNIGNIAVVIIAIIGVVSVIRLSIDAAKDGGSFNKVIIAVLITLVCVGLVETLMHISDIQELFGNVSTAAIKTTGGVANDALGGN